ncbi:hypothetical protein DPX16_1013 [Anabarilius grahami]|uniref:Uncharacterized protein n=1 Tax=Anabarilius grahami TaxID=495550 RepID=A0A3N0XRC4_ANAGA|nr:hypothetical protein DPX16_1013 [Anabarilius grahami]
MPAHVQGITQACINVWSCTAESSEVLQSENPFGVSEVTVCDIPTDFTKLVKVANQSQQSGPWECISRHSCPLRVKSQLWCIEWKANPPHPGGRSANPATQCASGRSGGGPVIT